MKPIDAKDKPKLFALIGMSVLVLGFGIYQVTAGMAGATPPPPPAKEDAKPSADATPPPAVDPQAAALAAMPTAPAPESGRDPFVPQIATASTTPPPGPIAKPQITVASAGNLPAPGGFSIGELFKGGERTTTPAANPGEVKPIEVPAPTPPTLAVAGVVVAGPGSGNKDVAVLRGGEKDRRYVTLGDPVGNGFVVSAIRLDGVEIMEERHTSRRFTFKTSK